MEKPKVFQNTINKNITNNKLYSDSSKIKQAIDVNSKINNMFKSSSYIYKLDVIITLKNKQVKKIIIGKKNNNLITIDNELIKIDDIIDINYAS